MPMPCPYGAGHGRGPQHRSGTFRNRVNTHCHRRVIRRDSDGTVHAEKENRGMLSADRSGTSLATPAIPPSSLVTGAFSGDRNDGCHGCRLLWAARRLARCHRRQWAAEDGCRAPGAPDEEVARLKRRIDTLNAARVALVEQIDIWVEGEIGHAGAGMLHTETLGSVVDRLAVAWVRVGNLAAAGDQPFLARRAWRQFTELAGAYDGLVTEVAAGRRRLPAWRPLKSYRTGAAGGQ